jgi:uncharacterized protein YuzE
MPVAVRQESLVVVKSKTPPTVEIDTEAGAAYVRFKRAETRIVQTRRVPRPGVVVTIDYDRDSEVIGVELLGVKEFSIVKLLSVAQVSAPHANLCDARYIGAGRGAMAAVG